MITAAAKSLQSCPTLCDPIDGSPPGSTVHGILQARTLEWVAISLSNAWKWKVKVESLSRVRLLVTPGTAAHQAPSSMGFFQARVLEWGVIAFSNSWLHNSWRLEFRFIKGLRVFCYFLTHSRHDYIVMFLAFHFPFEENFTFWSLWK